MSDVCEERRCFANPRSAKRSSGKKPVEEEKALASDSNAAALKQVNREMSVVRAAKTEFVAGARIWKRLRSACRCKFYSRVRPLFKSNLETVRDGEK